jgi:hypothetical protein
MLPDRFKESLRKTRLFFRRFQPTFKNLFEE